MTKENKGICYIKYDKASAAAMAIENMDGKMVGDEPKPIKVSVCVCVLCNCECDCVLRELTRCSIKLPTSASVVNFQKCLIYIRLCDQTIPLVSMILH